MAKDLAPAPGSTAAVDPAPKNQPKPTNALPALSVTVEPDDYQPPDAKLYWVGLTQDAPVHEVIVGPCVFRKYSRRLIAGYSGQSQIEYPGGMARLSDADVKHVLDGLKLIGIEIVRGDNERVLRAQVGRLRHGMEPAAQYCWMEPATEIPNPGAAQPKTLLKT